MWKPRELLTGALLWIATAAFVFWQNRHLTVLWDLSYILENAARISLGQIPYRDFPFPYAPLTFVMQAAILKLFGRAAIHHYIYAAAAGACATLLTWRILLRQLAASALPPRLTAFLLASPLIFLGTASIFPHPFYDSDCTLAILFCLWLLLRLESRGWPPRSTFACGILLATPVFIKQNTGMAFLLAAAACIGWLGLRGVLRHPVPDSSGDVIRGPHPSAGAPPSPTPSARSRSGVSCRVPGCKALLRQRWESGIDQPGNRSGRDPNLRASALLLAGAATGLAAALALIQHSCGLGNYFHWTIQFAASRRLPGLATMLGVYRDPALLWTFLVFASGLAILCACGRQRSVTRPAQSWCGLRTRFLGLLPIARWIGCALLSLPFLWAVAALVLQSDDSDRAEALLHLWPVLLAASLAFALWRLRRAGSLAQLLPLILLAVIHGAFLSQQLWGSTYALWPLLTILIASILIALAPRSSAISHATSHATQGAAQNPTAPLIAFAFVVCLTLLTAGGSYALSHERLSYADLSGDRLEHSTLPPLRGMAMRGSWLPDFEELVAYTNREIPRGDAILTIPGEDLFYFTTGRTPRFPVIMLDNTVNPYSAEQIAELARQRNAAWVIVKRSLQLQEEPLAFRPRLLELLAREYEPVESLNNYDIYRRKQD